MNLLHNGAFDGGLDEWTGSGTIDRSLGYPRPACVRLADGQSIRQEASVGPDSLYTLHWFYRLGAGATLTVQYGSVTHVLDGVPVDAWREGVLYFALDESATQDVTFAAAGGTAYLDSVTLLAGGLPITRAHLAQHVAGRLADLATEAALSSTAAGDTPEGDYSAAIDEALRSLGAITRWGDADVTALHASKVNDAVDSATTAMLQRLRARYALQTDVTLGPRSESRSQIAGSIDAMLSGAGADRRVKVRPLLHSEWRR